MEKIEFLDFQNCIQLTKGEIEIIVMTDFGEVQSTTASHFYSNANQ